MEMDQQGIGVADVDCMSPAVGKRDTKRGNSALTPVRPQWRFALLDQHYHERNRRQEAFTFEQPMRPEMGPGLEQSHPGRYKRTNDAGGGREMTLECDRGDGSMGVPWD